MAITTKEFRAASIFGFRDMATPVVDDKNVAEGRGFEPLRRGSHDITVFKIGAISRSANLPKNWCQRRESNPQRLRLQRSALPIELPWQY